MKISKTKNCEVVLEKFKLTTPIFQALGNVNRQQIIMLLLENTTLNVNQIAERMVISRPAISHHLKILRLANLITFHKREKEKYYYLCVDELHKIKELILAVEANQ